jgi:DNA-binding SARP family transcriptional activator
MLALYRDGQPAEAPRVFHRLYQMLKDEVGVEPSHETMDLGRASRSTCPS